MVKNYTTRKSFITPKNPSENTIQFLLDYSKSLNFIDLNQKDIDQIEVNLN